MVNITTDRDTKEIGRGTTLGNLRLRNVETNEVILIPTPTGDPNDPLNWSKAYRTYLALLVSFAMFLCNFLAAGPTVAIVDITKDLYGPPGPAFTSEIAKVAYFFTTTALLQGTGNLIWMPLLIKYGRRPVYIVSFACYTGVAAWCGGATSYGSELAGRIMLGFFAGAGECIGPVTISDIFFLHERGTFMAIYTAALSAGVSGGIILSGLITIHLSWRYIYWVAVAMIGASTFLVFLTMPETAFVRSSASMATEGVLEHQKVTTVESPLTTSSTFSGQNQPPKETYLRSLNLVHGKYTDESLVRMFFRPIVLLILPPVLWATLVMAVTIGFLVAISSNFATAFSNRYGFLPYQSGLCFISGLVGTMISIFFGGRVSDMVADFFTKRNGGIREPEMRLPAMTIGLFAAPLGLLLYGVGINNKLHWIVPTLGLGFVSFAVAQATNVSLTYIVDAYRPISGETIVTQLAFKSCFGFLLSFYTNPWVNESGYSHAFGAMAGISAAVQILWIPLFFLGKQIRRQTIDWKVMTFVGWSPDREVGE
ncbi:MFS general substrate transporter [Viridothelium virens]|uniref:MFS general substrate transporter n=1 Tax=Viridothelium virens TaxID=1048519 RepID=A0A6A6H8B1_VIRVR|nr:MFS general substrate transporter [Viridothelium virens]